MTTSTAACLVVMAPAGAACLAGLLALARRGERVAPVLTIAAAAISVASAAICLRRLGVALPYESHITWLTIQNGLTLSLGVRLDSLTYLMLGVVLSVSLLVQVYSVGYMRGEAGYGRYFAYLSLFTASMVGLVCASDLVQLYICWEMVGICSFLLIGFWWHKPAAAAAAKKAFVVTRFGDMGFLLGILLLASVSSGLNFEDARSALAAVADGTRPSAVVSPHVLLWLAPLLLFCGAVGKSAQFPLHVWLPDAMEGPTPVSALIHAATMVAAGVYMVARLFPLFTFSPIALLVVLVIGMITAALAGTVALVQWDIKKVMAYSTVSQLGYMMVALGAAATLPDSHAQLMSTGQVSGLFHLTTHAAFKALLFLAAGSVIHALHRSPNPGDLRLMGGLRKRLPITSTTCLVGVLALAGIPPFSGFWSKDAILASAWRAAQAGSAVAGVAVWVCLGVAGITALYSVRMWMLAFWGDPRTDEAREAHESPMSMVGPLCILALAACGLGWYLHDHHRLASFLGAHTEAAAAPIVMWLAMAVAVAGAVSGYLLYSKPGADPLCRMPGTLRGALENLWYVEAGWRWICGRALLPLGCGVAWFDRTIIDGTVRSTGPLARRAGSAVGRWASGQAQAYSLVFWLAAFGLAAFLLLYETVASSGGTRP